MRDPAELTHAELIAEVHRLRALLASIPSPLTDPHPAADDAAACTSRLNSLITHAPIGIAMLDTALRYQHINAHLAALNGLAPEAHLGRTTREVLPALAPELEAVYNQVLTTGEPLLAVETVGETPAAPGVERAWRVSYFPVRAADGAMLGIGIIVMEITAQRHAELALHAQHQQLETILQTLDEGVMAVRPDGTIAAINSAAQRHLLLPPAHQEGSAQDEAAATLTLLNPDGAPLPRSDWPMTRVLHGERISNLVLPASVTGEPDPRWLALSGTPVIDTSGALVLGVLTCRDITRHKRDSAALQAHTEALSRINADLARALRLKDEFLALMSHELRTPLNAVLGIAGSLGEEHYGPISERQRHALAQIEAGGRHLLAILSDILDLARIEAGAVDLERDPIEVEGLCRWALQMVASRAQERGVQLRRTVAYGVEGLRADERRLRQILVNLLDNAVKFTPAGGSVSLEVEADAAQEQISFIVRDTGIGIAAEDMDRLFQPFTQVDGRLARQYEGIGLGLTLVQRLTDLHRGSVQLESTPGKGSRFTITLPWSEADNVVPTPPAEPQNRPRTWERPPHVVIADDHEITLSLYTTQLTQMGCVVTTARTGAEAIARVHEGRPDVVVVDIQMPEINGMAVIERIRLDPAVGTTPIIAVTALAMPGDRERCLAAGATRYLAKPVSGRVLAAMITEVITAPEDEPAACDP